MLYNPEENKSQENSNNIKSENDQKLFSKFKKIKTMLWKK